MQSTESLPAVAPAAAASPFHVPNAEGIYETAEACFVPLPAGNICHLLVAHTGFGWVPGFRFFMRSPKNRLEEFPSVSVAPVKSRAEALAKALVLAARFFTGHPPSVARIYDWAIANVTLSTTTTAPGTSEMSQQDELPLAVESLPAAKPAGRTDCAVSCDSASEEWVCGLIAQIQDKLDHRIGENITLPLDLVAHVQSALISSLRAWDDQERLDWLSSKRSPGTVHLTFNGATIAKAQSVRDVIDAAMRGPNTGLTGANRTEN